MILFALVMCLGVSIGFATPSVKEKVDEYPCITKATVAGVMTLENVSIEILVQEVSPCDYVIFNSNFAKESVSKIKLVKFEALHEKPPILEFGVISTYTKHYPPAYQLKEPLSGHAVPYNCNRQRTHYRVSNI